MISKQLLLSFWCIFQLTSLHAQVSLQEITLSHGTFSVGFRQVTKEDATRNYQRVYDWTNRAIPRPIMMSMWYPSEAKTTSLDPMTILEYMQVLKAEWEWEHLPNEQLLNWWSDYPNTPANQAHLQEQTTAFRDLNPADGKFPVVLYAPSAHASSIENFAICEYLASHGYWVITSPSRGTTNQFLEGGTVKDMETQARDIEFLLKELSHYPQIDQQKIATMGFSFGGLSNVLAQMRQQQIKAIVSLDGTIRYAYPTLMESPFADMDKVNVPFIHFAQKEIPQVVLEEEELSKNVNTDFEFYDSLTNSEAYSFRFHDLTHAHFSTLGVLFYKRDPRQDKSDQKIMASYRWLGIYSLNFLNAYLKDDQQALAFIQHSPLHNKVPAGLLSQRMKKPVSETLDFRDFNDLAAQQRYEDLKLLYDKSRQQYPNFTLPEWKLNNLGLQLLYNPKTSQQGIRVFELAVSLYPNSANLFDSLAEAYLFVGNKKEAAKQFKKSLALNPQNQNAINRLEELRED